MERQRRYDSWWRTSSCTAAASPPTTWVFPCKKIWNVIWLTSSFCRAPQRSPHINNFGLPGIKHEIFKMVLAAQQRKPKPKQSAFPSHILFSTPFGMTDDQPLGSSALLCTSERTASLSCTRIGLIILNAVVVVHLCFVLLRKLMLLVYPLWRIRRV